MTPSSYLERVVPFGGLAQTVFPYTRQSRLVLDGMHYLTNTMTAKKASYLKCR